MLSRSAFVDQQIATVRPLSKIRQTHLLCQAPRTPPSLSSYPNIPLCFYFIFLHSQELAVEFTISFLCSFRFPSSRSTYSTKPSHLHTGEIKLQSLWTWQALSDRVTFPHQHHLNGPAHTSNKLSPTRPNQQFQIGYDSITSTLFHPPSNPLFLTIELPSAIRSILPTRPNSNTKSRPSACLPLQPPKQKPTKPPSHP